MKVIDIGYDNVKIKISKEELETIIHALNLVTVKIEEWEFTCRIGAEVEEAKQMANDFSEIYNNPQLDRNDRRVLSFEEMKM